MFGLGAAKVQGDLMISAVLIGATGFLYFGTFGAKDALVQVEIDEDGIRVVDDTGEPMCVTEYRYVRSTEVQKICIMVLSKDHSKHS